MRHQRFAHHHGATTYAGPPATMPKTRLLATLVGPLTLISNLATMLGVWEQVSLPGLPVAILEFSVGVHLTAKRFRSAALTALKARPSGSTDAAVDGI